MRGKGHRSMGYTSASLIQLALVCLVLGVFCCYCCDLHLFLFLSPFSSSPSSSFSSLLF